MRNKNLLLILLIFATLLVSCKPGDTPAVSETVKSGVTTTENKVTPPEIEEPAEETIYSTKLYVDDEQIVYVSPTTGYLMRTTRKDSKSTNLYEGTVWEEFLVAGGRILFRDTQTGHISSIKLDGNEYTKLFKMPFYHGIMRRGSLYFIDTSNMVDETVLYVYTINDEKWSTHILAGNRQSCSRQTIVFGDDNLYYLSITDNTVSIISMNYENGEKRTIFTAARGERLAIPELFGSKGGIYYSDPFENRFIYMGKDERPTYYPTGGDRIFAVITEGLLFAKSENYFGNLLIGNTEGQVTECKSGKVLSYHGARAFIQRLDVNGREYATLVKYPEDVEQIVIHGEIHTLITHDRYALAFFYDNNKSYLIDMAEAEAIEYELENPNPEEVTIDQYLSEGKDKNIVPSASSLLMASPGELVAVFTNAAVNNDRHTLIRLYGSEEKLPPYPDLYMKSYTVQKESDTGERIVYTIDYVPYSERDDVFLGYWPEVLDEGMIILIKTESGWAFQP